MSVSKCFSLWRQLKGHLCRVARTRRSEFAVAYRLFGSIQSTQQYVDQFTAAYRLHREFDLFTPQRHGYVRFAAASHTLVRILQHQRNNSSLRVPAVFRRSWENICRRSRSFRTGEKSTSLPVCHIFDQPVPGFRSVSGVLRRRCLAESCQFVVSHVYVYPIKFCI